jgi:mycoredoxin
MSQPIELFGHSYCPQVHIVRGTLAQLGIPYQYIDIRKDDVSRERVRAINNGFESVPTLVFVDGSTLTEPSEDELYMKLMEMGYSVDPPSFVDRVMVWLSNPILSVIGVSGVLGGLVLRSEWIVLGGVLVMLIPWALRTLLRRS